LSVSPLFLAFFPAPCVFLFQDTHLFSQTTRQVSPALSDPFLVRTFLPLCFLWWRLPYHHNRAARVLTPPSPPLVFLLPLPFSIRAPHQIYLKFTPAKGCPSLSGSPLSPPKLANAYAFLFLKLVLFFRSSFFALGDQGRCGLLGYERLLPFWYPP